MHTWLHLVPVVVLTAVIVAIMLLRKRDQYMVRLDEQTNVLVTLHEQLASLHADYQADMQRVQAALQAESRKEEDVHGRIMSVVETTVGKCSATHEMVRIIDDLMRRQYPESYRDANHGNE